MMFLVSCCDFHLSSELSTCSYNSYHQTLFVLAWLSLASELHVSVHPVDAIDSILTYNFYHLIQPFADCPPGSILDSSLKCTFDFHKLYSAYYDVAAVECQRFHWVDKGFIPITKTYNEVQEYLLMESTSFRYRWVGLQLKGNQWVWDDGQVVDVTQLPSLSTQNWNVAGSNCSVADVNIGYIIPRNCKSADYVLCQTSAAST